jgi:hypothetical protein
MWSPLKSSKGAGLFDVARNFLQCMKFEGITNVFAAVIPQNTLACLHWFVTFIHVHNEWSDHNHLTGILRSPQILQRPCKKFAVIHGGIGPS